METDGCVYCEVIKGMYGLKQAAHLAFEHFVKILASHVYFPVQESSSLWKHQTRPNVFTLCVNNFGIKSNSMDNAHHLIYDIYIFSNAQST